MPPIDPDIATAYREAWEAWIKQVEHVHRVLLEGEQLRPDQLKGLLNREERAKQKYDVVRLKLLGVDPGLPAGGGDNPFR